MAQLPGFSSGETSSPLPITEESFHELCMRFLDSHTAKMLNGLSLEPPRTACKSGSAFIDAWYDWERNLRIALAEIRALRMKKEFNSGNTVIPPDVLQTARTACGMDSPLSAEQFLNKARLETLDRICPLDAFSTDALFAYALKLKQTARMKLFDEKNGMSSYRMIYDKILGESV